MVQIFYGGTVLTMDELQTGDGVLVVDGRIAEVGSAERMKQEHPEAVCHDLQGGCLMPAFLDAHSHFTQVASSLLQVSLEGVTGKEELKKRLQAFAAGRGKAPGEWLLARDFDVTCWEEEPVTRELLDWAMPGYPVVMAVPSGHMGYFSSEALRLLEIDEQTPVPEGGSIEQQDGRLTGYLEENAFFYYQKKTPMPGLRELAQVYQEAEKLYASYGITTMQDGMLVKEMLPLYQLLLGKELLQLDLVAYASQQDFDAVHDSLADHVGQYRKHLKLGGMKIFLDGSPQGRTAWMREPYEGSDECGYGTMSDAQVLAAMERAAEDNCQLLAHCNGDRAAEQFLTCLAQTEQRYPEFWRTRPVMIHAQLLAKDQLPAVMRLGVMPSFFVAHVYHWGEIHRANFGEKRAGAISPAKSAAELGIRFTFHQDSPVILPDMFETIWCSVARKTKDGAVLGAEQAIPVKEALAAVTVHAAYQYHEETEKGSITPGKCADLIVVSANPLAVPTEELRFVKVLETYKNGMCIYSSREA